MKMTNLLLRTISACLLFLICKYAMSQELNFQKMIQKVPVKAKFTDPGYHVWCGSMVKSGSKYYLFYSRWPAREPFDNWVVSSEVAVAVADSPIGPYRFSYVALKKRPKQFWDADCTHNPTIHHFKGKYYLYYMGNYGDSSFWSHRNHQRIGVAWSMTPRGPWKRFDHPLIDVSAKGYDSLMVSNPAVCSAPDGKYVMVYKAVGDGPKPFGGTVRHLVAFASNPLGPFVKQPQPVFSMPGVKFPAEDPFIWYQEGKYWALVKDFKGTFTQAGPSIALFESIDAKTWEVAENKLAFKVEIPWIHGTEQVQRLERPQLFFENGRPSILFAAVMSGQSSFNVAIPLKSN